MPKALSEGLPYAAICSVVFVTEVMSGSRWTVTLRRGLPFSVEIPNPETREAMRQALEDEDLKEWSDLESLKRAQG